MGVRWEASEEEPKHENVHAKALRELGPVPYELVVANAQCSSVIRPSRATSCVVPLKPRSADDGTVQFTP